MLGNATKSAAFVLVIAAFVSLSYCAADRDPPPRIAAQDNRVPAGVLRDGVLT